MSYMCMENKYNILRYNNMYIIHLYTILNNITKLPVNSMIYVYYNMVYHATINHILLAYIIYPPSFRIEIARSIFRLASMQMIQYLKTSTC